MMTEGETKDFRSQRLSNALAKNCCGPEKLLRPDEKRQQVRQGAAATKSRPDAAGRGMARHPLVSAGACRYRAACYTEY
jgi:hypothetical protein